MNKYVNKLIPDIESLSQKDSSLSTKRYADLRLINHFILLSWASFCALFYFQQWDSLTSHLLIVGVFATGRGVMALEIFSKKNKILDNAK